MIEDIILSIFVVVVLPCLVGWGLASWRERAVEKPYPCQWPDCVGMCQVPCDYDGVPYVEKCKRLRTDGPTPCLCCAKECVG